MIKRVVIAFVALAAIGLLVWRFALPGDTCLTTLLPDRAQSGVWGFQKNPDACSS